MNKKNGKQLLAMLLLFAMFVGFMPAISMPAQALHPIQRIVKTEDDLRDALADPSIINIAIDDGGTEFTLTAPIDITRSVNIQGLNRKTGEHQATRATVIKAVGDAFTGDNLFTIYKAGEHLEVSFVGLTIDVDNAAPPATGTTRANRRAIYISNGSLQLGDLIKSNDAHCYPTTIKNGYVGGAGVGGGAIHARGSIIVARNVKFDNNEAEPVTGSGGGAVYVGGGDAVFTQCDFRENVAYIRDGSFVPLFPPAGLSPLGDYAIMGVTYVGI